MIKLIKLTALAAVLLTTLTGCATPSERIAACMQENGYDVQTCAAMEQSRQEAAQFMIDNGNQILRRSSEQQAETMRALNESMRNSRPQTLYCKENTNPYTGTTLVCN